MCINNCKKYGPIVLIHLNDSSRDILRVTSITYRVMLIDSQSRLKRVRESMPMKRVRRLRTSVETQNYEALWYR